MLKCFYRQAGPDLDPGPGPRRPADLRSDPKWRHEEPRAAARAHAHTHSDATCLSVAMETAEEP